MSKIKSKSKAQGLPITVIIIAALGLAILFILLYATSTKVKFFGKGVEEEAKLKACEDYGEIKSVTECKEPLLGNYGEIKDDKVVPLPPTKVCCALGK